MPLSEISSVRLSPRVTIRPGDVVRLSGGGPEYKSQDGSIHRYRMPGQYLVKRLYQSGQRVWVDVSGLGGCHTVFISGKPYRRACLVHKPYKVKIKRTHSQKRLAFG